ncbi:MAG: DUF4198 domain-containing protein [Motiliproteus sp.]|nr:DUF4198 domain-containing protein [Motiliproteus sp.]MCW9051447.1 DUF4198 domain-containing protein [Motiliproteus sp.]
MKPSLAALLLCFSLSPSSGSYGHFQELIPSNDIAHHNDHQQIDLQLRFTHPMQQGPLMEMAPPKLFGVLTPHGKVDLLESLEPIEHKGYRSFQAQYRFKQPGDHLFYLEPQPYWEADENKLIVHYTKVVVDAFSGPQVWDQLVGFPVEIEPLVRPYGLWSHNLFRGIVRQQGKPVPYAIVEVEWRNDGSVHPPTAAHVTQVIKADANGVFSYAMPRAGWWGFAALLDGPESPGPDGKPVALEQGALIWVYTRDMEAK